MLRKIQAFKGFTLIEILVVVGFVAVLAIVVFVALNPVERFASAYNSDRQTDVNNILEAVHAYRDDNNDALPDGLTVNMPITQIGTASTGCTQGCKQASASACVNLNSTLARYLKQIPTDPRLGAQASTGYYIYVDDNSIVTVGACAPENNEIIEVSG